MQSISNLAFRIDVLPAEMQSCLLRLVDVHYTMTPQKKNLSTQLFLFDPVCSCALRRVRQWETAIHLWPYMRLVGAKADSTLVNA